MPVLVPALVLFVVPPLLAVMPPLLIVVRGGRWMPRKVFASS